MYAVFSPRAVVEIKERVKIIALLDIRADVNIMIVKVADVTNLFILEIISMEIEIFTGYNV
jgi:hypothetical protein